MATKVRGRPSLGPREMVLAALAPEVRAVATQAAQAYNAPLSGYLSDVLCYHFGRPDLMRYLNQQPLPDRRDTTAGAVEVSTRRYATIRVPIPVARAAQFESSTRRIPASVYLADVISMALGMPEFAAHTNEEVITLAI